MLFSLNETYNVLLEKEDRLDSTVDSESINNKFQIKPQGVIIQDSYNNPFFPIRPLPRIDTSKMETSVLYERFRQLYSIKKSLFLPWHYCVEIVDGHYCAFNTRPLDMTFPMNSINAKLNKRTEWDNVTEMFFKTNIYDLNNAIHICVVGDSLTDVYTKNIYEFIGRVCINPIMRQYKLPSAPYQRTFALNMGMRFDFEYMFKFIRS